MYQHTGELAVASSLAVTAERSARATIASTLLRLGVAETALGEPGRTIARADPSSSSPVLVGMPTLSIDLGTDALSSGETSTTGADLVAREILGKGGMGVVRLAEQRSLGRDVAVKTTAKQDAHASRALIREARITGGLEHPNVVPVHTLGVNHQGSPVLVMKRIEGVSWRTLVYDDDHEAWGPLLAGHADRLRAHLEILAQVTRALAFAHDRGVVHRDVKPENVMIGRFGEVYLLDWGVALRMSERAAEPSGIVGTPGFLAPEMARGEPMLVTPATDVYLLGATLFEVLARRPPHDAPTALAALVVALVGDPPTFPAEAEVSPALASLVRRAMSRAPEDRPPSAEAFREEIARHLAQRAVDVVLTDARAALARADASRASDGASAPDAYRALVEARFAFASALRSVADPDVRQELDDCLARLVDREIALRSPVAARSVMGEMAVVPHSLREQVDALQRDVSADRAAVEDRQRARAEADSSRSLRAMLAIVASVITVVVVAWLVVSAGNPELDAFAVLELWTAGLAGMVVVVLSTRRQLLANATTRALTALLATMVLTPFACTLVALAVSAPMYQRSAFSWVAGAGLAAIGQINLLPQIWPAVVVYLLGTVGVLVQPGWANVIQPIVILGTAAIFVRALRLHAERSRVAAAP